MAISWTDDDLRVAISEQRSWRATARPLGLRGTSAGSIRALKRRAQTMGLDTAHFRGKRTWSDGALRSAVAAADSWSDVLRRLDLTDRADSRTVLRGHAVRLGLDISHLEPR